ncbi:excinuclease ATPase subunit [Aquabacterium soli]|uniref:excinuclease ATPase subunit n=1 Tax=Aquabacterium soli TaxID=2493092 RepID=UPI001F374AEC|nr:excinuclease ATPase subunit [Aquabacterium soli]
MTHTLRATLLATTLALSALTSLPAMARDTELHLPLADVLDMPEAKEKLDGSVKFYLAGQKTPKVLKRLESDVSNRKTNGVGKADDVACRWAALSALIAFQDKAKQLGANAVVDLVSYYKKNETKSDTNYECHAGAVVVGVALKGSYANVAP